MNQLNRLFIKNCCLINSNNVRSSTSSLYNTSISYMMIYNNNGHSFASENRSYIKTNNRMSAAAAAESTTTLPQSTLSSTTSSAKLFSEAMKKEEETRTLSKKEAKLEAKKAKVATATLTNVRYSKWKMMPLFHAITGLSYREAIAQLTFANIGPAKKIRGLVTSARYNAEYYKNLNPDRLIVSQIWMGRSHYQKSMEPKGRGRTGVRCKPFTHVTVEVKEIEQTDENEKKLGKFGKKHTTIERYNNPLVY